MDPRVFRARSPIVTLLVTAALVTAPTIATSADHSRQRSKDLTRSLQLHGSKVSSDQDQVQVFVRLDEPAVAELNATAIATTGKFAAAADQRAQAARVSQQQARMAPMLNGQGAHILSAQRVGANGFRVKVRASQVAALKSLPGVRSVGRVEIHKPDNIDSVPWIGAPAAWASVGRGEGVKIAVIDTGIDYTHADFGGSGDPAVYASTDKNVVAPGTFPTAKVVGGWDFAGATYDATDPDSVPAPDANPIDGNGHGTHVAGTAAGIGVPGSVGPGVAPGASLYALKVFGDAGGSTDLTSLAIEWAMDPNGDGDMSDHVDVINMSLGSPFGRPDDPSAISANNAAAVGIIVATSAGNEGNMPYVTGAPGIAASAISTAASYPGGRLYSLFTVDAPASIAGPYGSLEGDGPVKLAQAGPISGTLVPATPADGCAPLTNAAQINGNLAFIIRGTCGFIDKYLNAQAAGAKAIVVYNDGADPTRIEPLVMGGLDARVTIAGLMISYTSGKAILAATGPVTATLSVAPDPTRDDQIADFSSRGPGGGGTTFKPDLTAPGVAIVSAGVSLGTGSATLQGTSMASPHTAGAAALLREKYPNLNQSAIKALLQNSTVDANASGDTDLARQGVGALRVDRAVALTSYATPGGVSFGRLNPLTPMYRQADFTVRDIGGKRRNYSVTHVPHQTYPGVEVSCPSRVSLNGKGEAKVKISLRFDPRAAWRADVYDNAITSQSEVDGWCVLNDGKDTLRVGYLAAVDAASAVVVLPDNGLRSVKVRNFGPALGWAEAFTLAKLGGEQQNGTYGSIAATGFRSGDPALYAGFHVVEFGFALERSSEHLSNLRFTLEIDTTGDGVPDATLIGTDLSDFIEDQDPGTFATLQFAADGGGFIDWAPVTSWDFNDRTLILPFTREVDGGLLPDKFDYVLTVRASDGEEDVQRGHVDLAKEITPDLNSFGVEPNGQVKVNFSGPTGTSLWLLQNNIPLAQPALSIHIDTRKKK